MPSNPATSPEQRRMITFDAIAPDGIVEATRTRGVGPNKTGAKGSSTVYRINGSPRAAD